MAKPIRVVPPDPCKLLADLETADTSITSILSRVIFLTSLYACSTPAVNFYGYVDENDTVIMESQFFSLLAKLELRLFGIYWWFGIKGEKCRITK